MNLQCTTQKVKVKKKNSFSSFLSMYILVLFYQCNFLMSLLKKLGERELTNSLDAYGTTGY